MRVSFKSTDDISKYREAKLKQTGGKALPPAIKAGSPARDIIDIKSAKPYMPDLENYKILDDYTGWVNIAEKHVNGNSKTVAEITSLFGDLIVSENAIIAIIEAKKQGNTDSIDKYFDALYGLLKKLRYASQDTDKVEEYSDTLDGLYESYQEDNLDVLVGKEDSESYSTIFDKSVQALTEAYKNGNIKVVDFFVSNLNNTLAQLGYTVPEYASEEYDAEPDTLYLGNIGDNSNEDRKGLSKYIKGSIEPEENNVSINFDLAKGFDRQKAMNLLAYVLARVEQSFTKNQNNNQNQQN